jgi:hypothetical protein
MMEREVVGVLCREEVRSSRDISTFRILSQCCMSIAHLYLSVYQKFQQPSYGAPFIYFSQCHRRVRQHQRCRTCHA